MTLHNQYALMKEELNEIQWRHYLGMEALRIGYGGINRVMLQSGSDFKTIKQGMCEVSAGTQYRPGDRIRQVGGGRKKITARDTTLLTDLDAVLEPKGDPMRVILWTNKSVRKLVTFLTSKGHSIQDSALSNLLHSLHFSLKSNKKNIEGVSHPDRDLQFHHINKTVKIFTRAGNPVISVDCKKKELIGNFINKGKEWHEKGRNTVVNVYDFINLADGKAVPYGIYDIVHNKGFMNVGVDHDTAAFAVESIRRWWHRVGQVLYPDKTHLLITADGGGSNGSRNRLWKKELQSLANETKLTITVAHLPPATSKWNKIEHRLFSYISINWRGHPLTSMETIIELLNLTTTTEGLTVTAIKDGNHYPIGIKVTDKELATLSINKDDFHGEWNYTISPQGKR